MPTPKISVIIPTYNVEPYIKETLTSLFNQQYPPFEIIIVNDGSTDQTLELITTHFGHRSELRIHNQTNLGVGAARAKGLELATGDYVFFCDPDDVAAENLFEALLTQVAEAPELELFHFSTRAFVDTPQGRQFLRRNTAASRNGWFNHGRELLEDLILTRKYNAATWQYIFKRTVSERFEARFEGRAHEDHLFSMNIYLHSHKTYTTTQNGYFQRVRSGSLTRSIKDELYVLTSYQAYQQTLASLQKHIHKFTERKTVALNFMERFIDAFITECIKNNINLPGDINKCTRQGARGCNIYVHTRLTLIFPRVVFWWKSIRYSFRQWKRSLLG
jgi:glycosyltransferase involved in cell wall biosynthesis